MTLVLKTVRPLLQKIWSGHTQVMPKFSLASCTLKLLFSGSTFNLCHTMQSFLIQKPRFRDPSCYELRMLKALISNKIMRDHWFTWQQYWESNLQNSKCFRIFGKISGGEQFVHFRYFRCLEYLGSTVPPHPYPTTVTNEGLGRNSRS